MKKLFSITTFLLILAGILSCSAKPESPVLVLGMQKNFGLYIGEILKTEGFNEFQVDSFSGGRVNEIYLKQFDIVILPEANITDGQKVMLEQYVKNGGNLIAFRPDQKLGSIFGINSAEGTINEGYLAVENGEEAKGILTETMQYHGVADKYKLGGGKLIASLYSDSRTKTQYPAVVTNSFGKGRATAFLYNLPKSIVYTRQGNPEFAGVEKDGIHGLRGMDLFTDGWVDTSKNTINQADEQMRLLTRCIEKMNSSIKPLPRVWYFPDTLKSLATLTNDGEYNNEKEFEPQYADVDAKGAKMTIYILAVDKASKEWVKKWADRGHEMVGHPDDTKEAGNPGWHKMDSVLMIKKKQILDKYGIVMRTNTNHWFVWCGRDAHGNPDFAAEARLEEKNGIELDANYAHYDNNSNQGRFLGTLGYGQGNYAGSGMVMKYCGNDGKIINVYQHFNNVYDQQYSENRDTTGFYECFKGLLDRSLEKEVYSYLSIKSHNWAYPFSKVPLMKMLDEANAKGIPVWTAEKLLDFMKMKDEARFSDIKWSGDKLTFKLNSSTKFSNKLTFMVPEDFGSKKISNITANGSPANFINRSVKGVSYSMVSVEPGQNYSIGISYK